MENLLIWLRYLIFYHGVARSCHGVTRSAFLSELLREKLRVTQCYSVVKFWALS